MTASDGTSTDTRLTVIDKLPADDPTGLPTEGSCDRVAVSGYAGHLPLYRQ